MFSLFTSSTADASDTRTAHDFTFNRLTGGEPLALSEYAGKVLLIVNTASKCGFTGQYEGLESLYKRYKDEGLVVIGVPSNDFGAQEPGSADDIAGFCKLNYGVSFPMTEKTVVSGKEAHPLYVWAHDVLGFASAPKWNFHKYLIGRDGKPIDFFLPTTKLEAKKLTSAIATALKSGK